MRAAQPRPASAEASVATMFGLDVGAGPGVPPLPPGAPQSTGRGLRLSMAPDGPPRLGFPEAAMTISEEREASGRLVFRIERDESAGYLFRGRRYGTSLLGPDGAAVTGRIGEGGAAAWLRLLVAQVLPFAAILRGLEVLHASATVAGPGAIVLAGRTGAGKTATAAALCRGGSTFLADDVVALERHGSELLAHPGAPFRTAEGSREELVEVGGIGGAAPLEATFFLDRRADGPPEPRFEPIVDPRILLASTFNTVLLTPRRLLGLLDVCAEVGRRRVERVEAGPGCEPDLIAAAILDRVG
jgi:hypothetical protein